MQIMISILQTRAMTIEQPPPERDMCDIREQWHVKRALEVAAAGGHNILLVGPPGAGKAQLARTLVSLLPTTGLPYPLREPPSHIGKQAFVGEPSVLGELTLAHGGVLFLRDLDTFDLSLLAHLSQTIEKRVICVPLQEGCVISSAQFILVATVKPCPCGQSLDPVSTCLCSVEEIAQYRQRLKEVVRTCFAIEIEVPVIRKYCLIKHAEERSATIRQRVEMAREIQRKRYAQTMHLRVNAHLRSVDEVQQSCQMAEPAENLLKSAHRQLHLTPLEALRLQAVARTIADLADSPIITGKHFAEAIRYLSGLIHDE
jgi:magnesium chelatase family protein